VAPEEGAAEAGPPHRSEEVIRRERGREIERERNEWRRWPTTTSASPPWLVSEPPARRIYPDRRISPWVMADDGRAREVDEFEHCWGWRRIKRSGGRPKVIHARDRGGGRGKKGGPEEERDSRVGLGWVRLAGRCGWVRKNTIITKSIF
jgi:hypothetical protein